MSQFSSFDMQCHRFVTKLVLVSFLVGLIAAGTRGQEKPELFLSIERSFKEKEPGWKIEQTLPGQTFDPLTESVTFRAGKQQAAIDIWIWKREQDARQIFNGNVIVMDRTLSKRASRVRLPHLGDENFMWTNPGSDAWPTINFRKGRTLVNVFAPSVVVAKRFAQHILEEIDRAQ